MKQKAIWILLIFAFAGTFVIGAGKLIWLQVQNTRQEHTFEALTQKIAEADRNEKALENPYQEVFDQYQDMVAWIKIADTMVNYPVMQKSGFKNYYLRRDINGETSTYGTPYLQENCDLNSGDNLIIYGHAMKNGSMFGSLSAYEKESFWRQHPTIQFITRDEQKEYEIVAVFKINIDDSNSFSYWEFTTAQNAADYDSYVRQARALAFYDTRIIPKYGQQLLTLSTCEYTFTNGRLVVLAVQTQQ